MPLISLISTQALGGNTSRVDKFDVGNGKCDYGTSTCLIVLSAMHQSLSLPTFPTGLTECVDICLHASLQIRGRAFTQAAVLYILRAGVVESLDEGGQRGLLGRLVALATRPACPVPTAIVAMEGGCAGRVEAATVGSVASLQGCWCAVLSVQSCARLPARCMLLLSGGQTRAFWLDDLLCPVSSILYANPWQRCPPALVAAQV
jgi:hypothetical protein